MSRSGPILVIDARPRGPHGPLAAERVLGRPVLAHLVDLAGPLEARAISIHARTDEQAMLRSLLDGTTGPIAFVTGPPPEGALVVRADRLYDPSRLRRAALRGRDPESAVLWRLDGPHGLAVAGDELTRRRTYQPIGRFWALGPARALARALCPTRVRPNAVTAAAASLVLITAAVVTWAGAGPIARVAASIALALALVLDTADGHLARLQGTASLFGRWLDAQLDELGDMALHAAIAWAAFARDGQVAWLLVGMLYAMGKYLFVAGQQPIEGDAETAAPATPPAISGEVRPLLRWVRLAGHADVRWHLWIVLAACGRLDAALLAYALYFPIRAAGAAARKAVRHG